METCNIWFIEIKDKIFYTYKDYSYITLWKGIFEGSEEQANFYGRQIKETLENNTVPPDSQITYKDDGIELFMDIVSVSEMIKDTSKYISEIFDQ